MDRALTSILVVVIFIGIGTDFPDCSAQVSVTNVSDINDAVANMTEMTTTTRRPLTIDDFIMLDFYGLSDLRKQTKIRLGGYFLGKYLIVFDSNSTSYLVPLPNSNKAEEELKEKLKNHTGDGLICVGHLCLTKEQSLKRLKELEALRLGKLLPGDVAFFAISASIICSVIIVGLTGNLLIIISVLRSRKMRNSTSVLICCLAASDTLILAICLPLQIVNQFFKTAYINIEVCRLWYFLRHFSIVSSSLTMSAMAIDRYIAVCHPLKAKSYCTVKNARYAVSLVWFASLALSTPTIWLVIIREDLNAKFCVVSFQNSIAGSMAYYLVVLAVVLVIPLAAMLPTYLKIFCVLWKSTSEAKVLQNAKSGENGQSSNDKQEGENIRSRLQVIRMLVVVLVMFAICWGPPTLVDAYSALEYRLFRIKVARIHPDTKFILNTIGLCNSFFNPLIYFCMSRQFRGYVVSMFKAGKRRLIETSTASGTSRNKTGTESISDTTGPVAERHGKPEA